MRDTIRWLWSWCVGALCAYALGFSVLYLLNQAAQVIPMVAAKTR